jgi:tRNA (guanine-N7-)-methyltransferase
LLPDAPRGQPGSPIEWAALFGDSRPVEIEVGFGKGLFLINAATSQPDVNFFGVEIVRKCQLYTATRVAIRELRNIRLACGDALPLLRDRVPAGSAQAVHVYFPDPWWKKRHHKRRLFTPEFVNVVAKTLKNDGVFHIATDVAEYFEVIQEILKDRPPFAPDSPVPATEARDDLDYLTNFERKFRKQGKPIWRAAYRKTTV